MKSNAVNITEIVSGYQYRFKPNAFLIDSKRTFAKLKSKGLLNCIVSDYCSDIFRPGIFKRIFVKDLNHGKIYLTAQAMVTEDPRRMAKILSTKLTDNLEPMILNKNGILVSCAGTVGNIRLISKSMDCTVGSQDIIRVIPKEYFGFVYAYLSSNTVYDYLQSQIYGSVVHRIEPETVSTIPVPDFTLDVINKVEELIRTSSQLRDEAIEALDKAKEILSKYLNVSFKKEYFKTSVVSSKDIWNSLQHRLDPPAIMNDGVYSMQDITSKMNHTTIANINGKVYRPGIFKRNYVSNGIPYIKGSEIFLTNPFRRCEQLSRTLTPFIDEMSMKEGQILITCAGSVGDIKLITKEYEDKKSIGSQDIIRLESDDELYTKEYLFVYLQQPFVYDYIQSMKYGSVIERIEPFHVESIPVIEPTKELSNEITSIVRHYMDCTYQAFKCEEKAISMVEEEIEKWNKN
jgi:restriction endonuclease S subunit